MKELNVELNAVRLLHQSKFMTVESLAITVDDVKGLIISIVTRKPDCWTFYFPSNFSRVSDLKAKLVYLYSFRNSDSGGE